MRLRLARRTATVLVAAAAAMAAAGVAPVAADDGGNPVITLVQPTALAVAPAGTKGVATSVQPSLEFRTTAASLSSTVTLTIDATDLAKVAKVTFSGNCTVVANVATCAESFFYDDLSANESLGAETQMTVRALPGAAIGASGGYTVTGSSDTATVTGATGTVRVGGPSFAQARPAAKTGLAVGSTVGEPVRFTNVGDQPADSTEVDLVTSPGLEFATTNSNCRYSDSAGDVMSEVAVCTFPGTVDPGETLALATPVRLRVLSTAYYTFLDTMAVPTGDPTDSWATAGRTFTQGTGQELGLKVITAGTPSDAPAGTLAVQGAGNHSDYLIDQLQAANTADFAVTGDSATAAQGDTVTLHFSMANHGPATIFDRSGEPLGVQATPPPGTTVVGSSDNCVPSTGDDPQVTAHGPYSCSGSYLETDGMESDFSLTLRVDTVTPGAAGTVAMAWSPDGSWRPPYDTDATDDSAALTLN
jgi:hypothetical protein